MQLYRFSPIRTEERLREAVIYIANKTSELSEKIIGQRLPIFSLTIFSHYPDEFKELEKMLSNLGSPYKEHNGPRIILSTPIKIEDNAITHLRIRQPDPYRMQVGCDDFDIPDYKSFKDNYLLKYPNNLRLIEREDYEMIEFFDPDYDVLAYLVSKQIYA